MKMLCPHCGVKGTADDSYIGKKVKCPKCEGTFEVETSEMQEIIALQDEVIIGEDIDASQVVEPDKTPEEETPEEETIEEETLEEEASEEVILDEKSLKEVTLEEERPEKETLEWSDIASDLDGESVDEEEVMDDSGIKEEGTIDEPVEEESIPVVELEPDLEAEEETISVAEELEPDVETVKEVLSSVAAEDVISESTGKKTGEETEERAGTAPVLGSDVASTLHAQGYQGNDPNLTEPATDRPDSSGNGVIKRWMRRIFLGK